MKKRIFIIFALILALALSACTEKEPDAGPAPGTAGTDAGADALAEAAEEFSHPGWVCKFDNGKEIPLGALAADVLSALGDPSDVLEAPSCIREGTDRVYTYAGMYTVNTQPDAAGQDRIVEVNLLTDAVALDVNGQFLMIGSDVSEADAAFGEPFESDVGIRRYFGDNWLITVTDMGGEINGITVVYPMG